MHTCIIIPNWNGADFLRDCLDSLHQQTQNAEIVVVDNGSRDDSLELLAEYPDVRVIALDRNYGFAGGVNAGISYAMERDAQYVALLNNDAIAAPDWLESLLSAARKYKNAGIISSKLLSGDGKTIDSTGDEYSIWGTPFPRGRGEPNIDQYDTPGQSEVLAASGGASLYRVDMLRKVGLFDEWFFAYYEDVDISLRTRLAGWGVYYAHEAVVYHRIGATSSGLPDFSLKHQAKNFLPLFVKNIPGRFFWYYGWRVLGVFGFKMLQLLKKGRFRVLAKVVGALIWHLPAVLRQRRRIQKHRRINPAAFDEQLYHAPPPTQPGLVKIVNKLHIK